MDMDEIQTEAQQYLTVCIHKIIKWNLCKAAMLFSLQKTIPQQFSNQVHHENQELVTFTGTFSMFNS